MCYYKLKQYDVSLKHIADIIEKGIKEHPGNKMTVQSLIYPIDLLIDRNFFRIKRRNAN